MTEIRRSRSVWRLCFRKSPEADSLLWKHHALQEKLEASGYHSRNEAMDRVLTGLGFSRADFDAPCSSFSAGWQMRIALARALLEVPDILLLDEPTNYLDIEARTWLEEMLRDFSGGFCSSPTTVIFSTSS